MSGSYNRALYNSRNDKVMDFFVWLLLGVFTVITLYPLIYVVSLAFSSTNAIVAGRVWLFPVEPTLNHFNLILHHELLPRSFLNSAFYTVTGTAYSLFLTVIGAYVLSKRDLVGGRFFMLFIVFTMLFSGGLIPMFLVVKDVGMYNSWLSMVIPFAISQWNLILIRTYIRTIPESLFEAARIDGANGRQVFWRITLPLLQPIVLLVFIITTISSYNVFTQVYIMTSGAQGSGGATLRTMVFDIYENAFRYFRTGYAAAEAVILFLIILILTFIQFGLSGIASGKEQKK